eukprot:965102-Amphidinium_carterae.5
MCWATKVKPADLEVHEALEFSPLPPSASPPSRPWQRASRTELRLWKWPPTWPMQCLSTGLSKRCHTGLQSGLLFPIEVTESGRPETVVARTMKGRLPSKTQSGPTVSR